VIKRKRSKEKFANYGMLCDGGALNLEVSERRDCERTLASIRNLAAGCWTRGGARNRYPVVKASPVECIRTIIDIALKAMLEEIKMKLAALWGDN